MGGGRQKYWYVQGSTNTPPPLPFLDARRGGRVIPAGGKIGPAGGLLREGGGWSGWLADPAVWEGVGVVLGPACLPVCLPGSTEPGFGTRVRSRAVGRAVCMPARSACLAREEDGWRGEGEEVEGGLPFSGGCCCSVLGEGGRGKSV